MAGLKVVELASVLAGPAVGMFFAELGAEVIKVENKKTGGDVTRNWKLPQEDPGATTSAYYCSVNWGKSTYLLDLDDPDERQQVLGWLAEADVVISNFRLAAARRMGMDFETLQQLNPKLIYAQITGFGDDSDLPAFDVVLQAEAGFLYMTGAPDGDPVKMPVALIDLLAAHQLKEGILLSLLHRERTGRGSYVTVSLLESALASLANQATNWLMAGQIPRRMGAQHPNIAPYGDIFYCADGKPIVLAVGVERQFEALCRCLELPELPADARFATNAARVRHRAELISALQPAIAGFDRPALIKLFHEHSVPVGCIRNMQEVFELPAAQAMILEEPLEDQTMSKRVKTVAFRHSFDF